MLTSSSLGPAGKTLAVAALTVIAALASTDSLASSLRFYGNGVNDIDRVKIRIDDPGNNNPGPPADIGDTDFTIEFWLRPTSDNVASGVACGTTYDWITGNIVFDRDRFSQGRAFGVSLSSGRLVFGVQNGGFEVRTLCSNTDLRDGSWHHVAVQRRRSDGFLWIYVDGSLDASGTGPGGDLSYPDNGVPGNYCSGPCTNSDPFIVIGAEKHDAGPQYPSYFGSVDELRLSTVLRYSGNFTPAQQAFVADSSTAALYHFDEGSGDFIGDSASGSLSPGERRFGGNPAGPVWQSDTPFSGGGSPGTLQFSASNYAVAEGDGGRTISVTRSGGSIGAATVGYSTSDGTAIAGADYQATSGTLTWASGDASAKSFTVPIVDDSEVESSESVNLDLANATGAALGARRSALLTISDNDVLMPGQLQFSASSYSVSEGAGTLAVFVNRTGGTDGAVSISYTVGGGTATAGADYQPASGILTWNDGDGSAKSFQVALIDDSNVEPDETMMATLSSPSGGATLGSPGSATLTITDNDVASPGSVQLSMADYLQSEGAGGAVITVTRTAGTSGVASVDYTVSDGTAMAGSDYQNTSGTLVWPDGVGTPRTFTIAIVDDAEVENDETVNISLSNISGANAGVPQSATLTIADNDVADPGRIRFSTSIYSASESAGALQVSVFRTGGTDGAVSVSYNVGGGTATVGADYLAASGVLTWNDGDGTAKSFQVTLIDDSNVETDETITATLSSPTGGATLGNPSSATLTITDNDVASPGSIQLSMANYTLNEGGGSAVVTVTRAAGNSGMASVDYSVSDGTATAGSDYQNTSGTLTWPDGISTSRTFTIAIVDDVEVENDETVNITLSNVTGANAGTPQSATLIIADNDVPNSGRIRLSDATYSTSEGDASVTIMVSRVSGSDGPASIQFTTVDGSANAGADYQAVSGSLNWADGEGGAKPITITIIDDAALEGDETVGIDLSNVTGAALGNPRSATLTIVDDDVAVPGSIRFSSSNYTIAESGGSIPVSVNRVGGSIGAVSVNYATSNGTASAGSDYQATSGSLSWLDGDVSAKSFSVIITNDTADESNETVILTLSNAGGGAGLGSPATATVTIDDDDAAPIVSSGGGGGSIGLVFLAILLLPMLGHGRIGRRLQQPADRQT